MTYEEAILDAIRETTAKIIAEESKIAAKTVERRVREEAGAIAARVISHFNMHRMSDELVITVDFQNTQT